MADAWRDLLAAADALGTVDTYRFDLVNVARQTLADHAGRLHRDLLKAWRAKNAAQLETAAARFLGLIADLDRLLATREEFLLGPWLEDARRWGATPAEQAKCAWNARRVLTLWGETKAINDYARKQWSGMLSGYYAPRWKRYLDAALKSLRAGKPLDEAKLQGEILEWTKQWADGPETYPTRPSGDSVAVARELWAKYSSEFKPQEIELDAMSLTTGKPTTCSAALPSHPARLAGDGQASDTNRYWATDVSRDPAAWWQVDLQQPTSVGRVVVVAYFADERRYGFTVEGSLDAQRWEMLADRRADPQPSTAEGYTCRFEPRKIRYLRVTQPYNSANTGRHLVEVMAFER
jgi:hypothetical protein